MSQATAPAARALAVATDTELAELDRTYARLDAEQQRQGNAVHRYAGDKQDETWCGRRRVRLWRLTDAEVLAACQSGEGVRSYDRARAAEAAAAVVLVTEALKANRAMATRLEQVWADNGHWSRFFVVMNSNGHIHYDISSHRCSRQPTTVHGWNPELSGATEAEAVAALGPSMCTVCFPSAPVEWTIGKPKPAKCAGSGQYVRYTGPNYRTVYVECPECHTSQARTSSGYVRAHKPA